MPTSYFRAPTPFWYIFYPNGNLEGGSFAVGAEVTFYRDTQREDKKPVYSDPAGLNPIENPLRLADLGRLGPSVYFADDELYFIQIKYPDGSKESIEGFPNFGSGGGGGSVTVGIDLENKLLNGQFRFNFGPDFDPLTADEIDIADNWTFKKNNTSATDYITFEAFNLGDDTVESTPIYRCRYTCTGQGSGETQKDFTQIMSDARTFEQTQMSFSMTEFSDSGRIIEVLFVQSFGTGGSPSADVVTTIGSFSLASGEINKISATFTVPSVSGKTLGTNNDDYVALVIRMPLDSTCDIWFTNVYLSLGDKILIYPRLTKEKEDSELLGAMIPEIQKDDYGKAIVANKSRKYTLGFPVPVGMSMFYFGQTYTDDDDWAICQGKTASCSESDGRYKRLYAVIKHGSGRGSDAWQATSNTDKISIATSTISAVTAPTNGTPSPTFTITQYAASSSANNHFIANIVPGTEFTKIEVVNKTNGQTAIIGNAGSGAASVAVHISGNANKAQISTVSIKAASAITGGQYFSVYTGLSAGFTFWYRKAGAGSAPSVAGTTNVQIDINTTDTAEEVTLKTLSYMTGYQVDVIQTVAATLIPTSSYINVNTNAKQYYVWFPIGGAGVDPKVAGRIGLKVPLSGSDTATQVATKIITVINDEFFKIPDLRGFFPRGYDPTGLVDFDSRVGSGVGSRQYDEVQAHPHPFSYTTFGELDNADGSSPGKWTNTGTANGTTGLNADVNHGGNLPVGQGGTETRPINIAVNYLIKL